MLEKQTHIDAVDIVSLPSADKIPSLPAYPLVGHIPLLRRDMLGTLYKGFQQGGDIMRYKLGPITVYAVSHPDLAQQVLVREKHIFRKMSRPNGKKTGLQLVLGNGLLTNPDPETWLVQRRMMQPMFHRKVIAEMGTTMTDATLSMFERWRGHYTPTTPMNFSAEMSAVTLDIINRTMFGADVIGDAGKVGEAVQVAGHYVAARATNPFSLPPHFPTPANNHFWRTQQAMDAIIYGLIEQRRASGETRGDLLDMLLSARDEDTGEGMSDQQLRDEVKTIFAAGHETTSNALSWTWYLLAQHPDTLALLQAEVDRVVGERLPTMADLPNLPYTLAVLEEAMRLYPPAPITFRLGTAPATLGGYTMPAGAPVIISIYNIHHHADFWEQPEAFQPERFINGSYDKTAYLPFGAGQRMCIGNQFALVEGQLLLALMAQHYTFSLVANRPVTPELAVTLRPKGGLWLLAQSRR